MGHWYLTMTDWDPSCLKGVVPSFHGRLHSPVRLNGIVLNSTSLPSTSLLRRFVVFDACLVQVLVVCMVTIWFEEVCY
jgi:hypothetical protein